MKFSYRLSYYLFGFLVGSIFLFFILNKKNTRCSYFPNDRVLNNIRSKPFYYSNLANKTLENNWLDTLDVKNTLQYGKVDFSRSNKPISGGKLYIIAGKTTKNQPIEIFVENYENKIVVRDIKKLRLK
jgi:hypothetical protein